ncbi:DNA breaking-rejoining enzyme, partial [Panus rudis PR-1116 ss-1]
LRPPCPASQRLFRWRGVNTPPRSVLDINILNFLADQAAQASLRSATMESYGAGLRKFHLFCDIFSVPEGARLPASFPLLHSFVLWATAEPDPSNPIFADGTPFEPVSVKSVLSYLAAVRAWHIVQGWPPPLTEEQHEQIAFSARGLANMQGNRRTRPPRPPITLPMLTALKATLNLNDPFEACIWAIATSAFWGLMRFGEVTVRSREEYSPSRHLSRANAFKDVDLAGKPYVRLDLPSAKTAKAGEIQHIYLTQQGHWCPIAALENLARVVPAGPSDPLFSWRDGQGNIRPMVRDTALKFINNILKAWGWGTAFGHSFRIGGASFLLAQKVDPEIIRLMGRWRSLAYQVYIRAFEQVASRHIANIAHRPLTTGAHQFLD